MRKGAPTWKLALAVLSVLLTALIWIKGLEESFSRPSVTPQLSLNQREMSFLAEPALPSALRPFLVGENPEDSLRESLNEIPLEEISDRNKLVLAALEPLRERRRALLGEVFPEDSLLEVKQVLLASKSELKSSLLELDGSGTKKNDPLLYQISCLAIGGGYEQCVDFEISRNRAFRLSLSQFVPLLSVLVGSGLLIRQLWMIFRKKAVPWPPLSPLPLSLVDMLLLVAGGFVVLGEVISPTLIAPITEGFTKGLASPVNESLKVFVGYISMTIPPLLILRYQIVGLGKIEKPIGGWLQWRFFPLDRAFFKAIKGWLMVMPLVLLTGWLMNLFVGDQGGSNPLLELVLRSRNPLALTLLVLITVVLAPLFEELVFRGALLPVLANSYGSLLGVVVSGLVFALAHLSVGEFPPLFVLGVGLGLMRLSSGRLFPCVLMHSIWNGFTFTSLILLGG